MITFKEGLGLLGPYIKKRLTEQIKAVAVIITYLIFFQTLILGIPIAESATISIGLTLVVVGLALFMEGLVLGLMPLGEVIGLKLPKKTKVPSILLFSFILGIGATFAEPAISVLKAAGSSVKAWEAPLLYLLLNKYSDILVYSVGLGVGLAVVFGMMRFIYKWSLKPFIYVLVGTVTFLTILGFFEPNIVQLTGLAWDCGAVTTGPVTVPLVLALGIGISRVVGGSDDSGGFGVVTLASLFPILTVLLLGFAFVNSVPSPMKAEEFFSIENREKAVNVFQSPDHFKSYAIKNANMKSQINAFDGKTSSRSSFIKTMATNKMKADEIWGPNGLQRWSLSKGTSNDQENVFGSMQLAEEFSMNLQNKSQLSPKQLITTQSIAALQAIIPLSLFLMITLWKVLKDRLPQKDEIFMGIILATTGMAVFNVGIELGLSKMGNQVGTMLPSAYKNIKLLKNKEKINNFDPDIVHTAIQKNGEKKKFFYAKDNEYYTPIPYEPSKFDATAKQYTYTPSRGPLFGSEGSITGIMIVLLFSFFMGYGATLAEPALNALGATVETITVGNFKKSLLMQAVALGVGVGITLGVAKIIWDIPLVFMLAPPYILLMAITWLSTEEFVNIGWDSAGVTTGPITVPLVLAMGLGIGSGSGVVEGFGILAMASVCPILSVLSVGLYVANNRKQSNNTTGNELIESEDYYDNKLKSA